MNATADNSRRALRRRRRPGRAQSLAVGAIVIAALAVVTYYAFNHSLPFITSGFRLNLVVASDQALQRGSPVRVAGVDVGAVTGVAHGPGDTAIVSTRIGAAALPIHDDATASVRPRLFLEGNSYIDLDTGSPSAPAMGDGATIPLARTRIAVQASQVLDSFDQATREHLQGLLRTTSNALSGSAITSLQQTAAVLAPTLRDLAETDESVLGTEPRDIPRFVASAAHISSTLAASRSALGGLVSGLNRTTGALADTSGALERSITGIDSLLRAAPPDLTAVDRSLGPLTRLARALNPALSVAPRLLPATSAAVSELGQLVKPAETTRLTSALNSVLVSLPGAVTDLASVMDVARPSMDCLRTHFVPVLDEKVPDGSLSTGQPVWQEFAHLTTGLAGSAQNFDANGYQLRILADIGQTVVGLVPGLGKVIASGPSSQMLGARPQWIGDLTPDDFQPEAPCAQQPLPNLAATTAQPDLRRQSAAKPAANLSRAKLTQMIGELK